MLELPSLFPFAPFIPSAPTVFICQQQGRRFQLFAFALDQDNFPKSPGFTWTTDNAGVATVNGSGLVTGVASGICTITVTANDNLAAKASTPVGVALLSRIPSQSQTPNYYPLQHRGIPHRQLVRGTTGAAQVYAGTLVNGFVVADHTLTAQNSGPTGTIIYTGPVSFTATAHVPVFVRSVESIARQPLTLQMYRTGREFKNVFACPHVDKS